MVSTWIGRSHLDLEIDILSTSVVHQSVQHIDLSLKIQTPKVMASIHTTPSHVKTLD